ncbi:hypothetical protein CTAYLR_006395 [Chrysophaeum taylorii]|uniref:Uncharacterized protein n=1 Tax=Chrysophaeum taylorii TaxID=2483200 RepID=A0AAD7U6Q1_9STRA|nr:hypothetical protein CTAYLR_006395 [Chrysophaeum taylorii]
MVRRSTSSYEGRILDVSMYNHEVAALRVRHTELAGVVEKHAVVMTEFKFQGGESEADGRVPEGLGIHVHRVARPECGMNAWCYESAARNEIGAAFVAIGGKPEDLVIISDVDEIPRRETLVRFQRRAMYHRQVFALEGLHFETWFGCLVSQSDRETPQLWRKGPALTTGATLLKFGAQALRTKWGCVPTGGYGCQARVRQGVIKNASFHLSGFFETDEEFQEKLRSNSDFVESSGSLADIRASCPDIHGEITAIPTDDDDHRRRPNKENWGHFVRYHARVDPLRVSKPWAVDQNHTAFAPFLYENHH